MVRVLLLFAPSCLHLPEAARRADWAFPSPLRIAANREFYGSPVPAADLLAGKVPAPEAASAVSRCATTQDIVNMLTAFE
jgi:hypothetical protein